MANVRRGNPNGLDTLLALLLDPEKYRERIESLSDKTAAHDMAAERARVALAELAEGESLGEWLSAARQQRDRAAEEAKLLRESADRYAARVRSEADQAFTAREAGLLEREKQLNKALEGAAAREMKAGEDIRAAQAAARSAAQAEQNALEAQTAANALKARLQSKITRLNALAEE